MPIKKLEVIGITLVVMSVVFIIGIYVNATIAPIALEAVPYTTTTVGNESITALDTGYVELTNTNDVVCSAVYNATGLLMPTAIYTCNNQGLLLVAGTDTNDTNVNVSYTWGADTATHTGMREVTTTFLSSMTLASITLIILAAGGILGGMYLFGKRG